MAITLTELPKKVQTKIIQAKILKIQRILRHDYPSGQTEISVFGIDSQGRNICKIFSFLMED